MFSRKAQHVLKIVVLTSLVWCLLDVFILNYFSGCDTTPRSSGGGQRNIRHKQDEMGDSAEEDDSVTEVKGLMDKFLDKVPEGE